MTTESRGTGRFALLAVVTFLLMLPETLPVPVLRGLVRERFAVSDSLASLFMVANMLGALVAAPLAGLWVDRSGRRRTLCIAALLLDVLAMQALAHPHDYGTFLLLRMCEGACHIVALTLLMTLVADAAGERRGRALGWLGAGLTIGVATGAAIGGVIGHRDPILTLHAASAVLLVAAIAAFVLLPHDLPPQQRPRAGEVWTAIRSEPGIRMPLVLSFIDRFTVGFFVTGFPLLLAGVHHVEGPDIGKLLAAFLYPFGVLSYLFGRLAERWSRRAMVCWGSLLYGLGVASVGAVPVTWLWGIMPVLGIGSALMFVPTLLWLLERSPHIGKGTAMAAFHTAGSLGFLLGPLCCGLLVASADDPATGYLIAFAVAGGLEILGAFAVALRAAN